MGLDSPVLNITEYLRNLSFASGIKYYLAAEPPGYFLSSLLILLANEFRSLSVYFRYLGYGNAYLVQSIFLHNLRANAVFQFNADLQNRIELFSSALCSAFPKIFASALRKEFIYDAGHLSVGTYQNTKMAACVSSNGFVKS